MAKQATKTDAAQKETAAKQGSTAKAEVSKAVPATPKRKPGRPRKTPQSPANPPQDQPKQLDLESAQTLDVEQRLEQFRTLFALQENYSKIEATRQRLLELVDHADPIEGKLKMVISLCTKDGDGEDISIEKLNTINQDMIIQALQLILERLNHEVEQRKTKILKAQIS